MKEETVQALKAAQKAGLEFEQYPKIPIQPRQKPMRVLCLGLSRTGTMSLYLGLNKLGIKCYHMSEASRNSANGAVKRWCEAIEAKYFDGRTGRLETAKDFDELLWQYQAVTDIPCVLFVDELLRAYPDAKVILTERDEDGWMRSIENSFYTILSWRVWQFLQLVDWSYTRHYIPVISYPLKVWTQGDESNREKLRQGYRRHNAHVRSIVPKHRLLLYHASQGWEPLCRFLEVPVPKELMSRVNEGTFVVDLHAFILWMRLTAVAKGFVKKASPILVGALGWWLYQWTQSRP